MMQPTLCNAVEASLTAAATLHQLMSNHGKRVHPAWLDCHTVQEPTETLDWGGFLLT
jgi:hypothetical protein